MRNSVAISIFAFCAVLFGLLLILPIGWVIRGGFLDPEGNFTLEYIAGVFLNPIYAEGLLNSFLIAIGTTSLVCIIAIPLAWLANRFDFAGKRVFSSLILVPMILPPFVGAIGFQQIFGQFGSLNALLGILDNPVDWLGDARMGGVILLQALGLYPIMYLNVAAALANIDPAMEEAAENLGCTGFTKFRRITLPLIMPGLFAGGTIVFIWSFTELGTPLILNYSRCTPVQVFNELKDISTNPFPFALVFVMLTASVLLYLTGKLLFGRKAYAMQSKAATVSLSRRATGLRGVLVLLPFVLVTGIALLPHFGVILTAFSTPGSWYQTVFPQVLTMDNFSEALGHQSTISSIQNSLTFSLLAVLGNCVVGIAIAMVIVRSNLKIRWILDTLAMLPLAVPGLVMAFGFLAISSYLSKQEMVRESAWLDALVNVQTNPTLFLVLAYSIRRLPYMVRSAVAGLQQTSVTLEEASANLGATPWTTLRRITLPLITANLIAGAMLAFSFSMLEVSDSLMLAQQAEYYPITKTIYELFQLIGTGKYLASALGVWAMVFLAATIIGASMILGKKLGAIFRA